VKGHRRQLLLAELWSSSSSSSGQDQQGRAKKQLTVNPSDLFGSQRVVRFYLTMQQSQENSQHSTMLTVMPLCDVLD
jgi:hypothetical protein